MRSRLVAERMQCQWTQKQVARQLGLSEVFIRKLEKGDANPSVRTMLKFERLYNVSMRDLFPDIFE